ncbi:NAD-dependent epimerase/dehydratase family protein [Mycobacterium deserti]|uniref:NAD-dependent epimerase/dehydratase family protein n=1 Tax=Mycobacterium deserti TaxID=2978347 RepID=A0ABT2MFQ5_9MYCO|nr:NAD-dependent epimerase/dehydratase family protein [Mycobacterium deserti]MCT7661116.1 NAD-dependent epimerase/dehydratase family protein [Mycobacterium deserti]
MTTPGRVVVTGASGNVGTGVLRELARQLPETHVIGVCRRPPEHGEVYERVHWHAVDLSCPDAAAQLTSVMRDADVVIHLALAVQPVRDEDYLYRANVLGSAAVFEAMVAAGVGQLVYASSLGIYAPGASAPVTEEWPDTGQATSTYSRHKVMVERILDDFVNEHRDVVVARFRPTVVVQREAAWLIKTLYLGPLVPQAALEMLRRRRLPILPLPAGVELQFVHADDVGDLVVRLMRQRARGSFNVAADVLNADALARLVGARAVAISPRVVRAVISALSAARLIALTPGWYDVATNTPLMDTSKARREVGWAPKHSSTVSARELIEGMADETVGASAAMGYTSRRDKVLRTTVDRVHDVSLVSWSLLTVGRAAGIRRAGLVDGVVVAANLVSGTPMALDRMLESRRDPVALLAPVTVVAALAATVRGGWTPVVATAALHLLNAMERKRRKTKPRL